MAMMLARSGRRSRRRGSLRRMSEINVTPFVDVMLVLLIIFMVAAPLLSVGVPLKLPETAADPLPIEQEEPLTISIDAEGRIFIQESETPEAGLAARVQAIAAERTTDRVFVRADAAVDYGTVARVMGALNAGGLRNIGLVTDQATPADGAAPADSQ